MGGDPAVVHDVEYGDAAYQREVIGDQTSMAPPPHGLAAHHGAQMGNNRGDTTGGPKMTIHELYPYLHVGDAAAAIEFYRAAFGATEKMRLDDPSGRIGHGAP